MSAVRLQLLRLALIAILVAVLGFLTTSRADADYAQNLGWHTVCAQDLTLYNNGPIGTFYRYYGVYISRWDDGKNHVWISFYTNGSGIPRITDGWVYNGWFC